MTDRKAIYGIVTECLRDILSSRENKDTPQIEESTILYESRAGTQVGLDSLDLVTLIVDVEQRLDSDFGISVTIADDRAMSERRSPFRSVGTLTDYVCKLAGGQV